MRELFHPTPEQFCLSSILNALGDPTRLQIVKRLAGRGEATCSRCNDDQTKSALSHHFKVLREAGIINVRIEGKQRFLSIRYEDLEKRFPGLIGSIINSL